MSPRGCVPLLSGRRRAARRDRRCRRSCGCPRRPPTSRAERRGDIVDVQFIAAGGQHRRVAPCQHRTHRRLRARWTGAGDRRPMCCKPASVSASVRSRRRAIPTTTIDPDDPDADLEPLVGPGPRSGDRPHGFENCLTACHRRNGWTRRPAPTSAFRSARGVAVGRRRGRRGPARSGAGAVADAATVTYDEAAVTSDVDALSDVDTAALSYRVYDVSPTSKAVAPTAAASTPGSCPHPRLPLSTRPGTSSDRDADDGIPFVDSRMEWGDERCYVVRARGPIGELSVESDARRRPACAVLTDTFPPGGSRRA